MKKRKKNIIDSWLPGLYKSIFQLQKLIKNLIEKRKNVHMGFISVVAQANRGPFASYLRVKRDPIFRGAPRVQKLLCIGVQHQGIGPFVCLCGFFLERQRESCQLIYFFFLPFEATFIVDYYRWWNCNCCILIHSLFYQHFLFFFLKH